MSVWQDIKSKLSIEEVVGEYVTLKHKGGGNFAGCCPFHNEKTPSMVCSSHKQIWHCFGCGEGGDIFTFVEMIEHCSSQEALQKLAKKASVSLDSTSFKKKTQEIRGEDGLTIHEKKMLLLEWVKSVYHTYLLKEIQKADSPVAQYCIERGLTRELIMRFQLGFAPDSHIISQLVKGDEEKMKILTELGVILR